MKKLIIQYLHGDYTVKINKLEFSFVKAATFIVPVFVLGVLAVLFTSLGLIPWLVFTALILLTFPIVKSNVINWFALAFTLITIITSFWSTHSWWEGLPFLYFTLGFFVKRTKFLITIKYEDLLDDEQRLNYLLMPDYATLNDPTRPGPDTREALIKRFSAAKEEKYKAKYVNLIPFLIPVISMVLLIVILIIFGEANPDFYERRGF